MRLGHGRRQVVADRAGRKVEGAGELGNGATGDTDRGSGNGDLALIVPTTALFFLLPSRLRSLTTGPWWGVGLGTKVFPWSEIDRFELPEPGRFGMTTEPVKLVHSTSGMRVEVPKTKWLRAGTLTELADALGRHRPCGPLQPDVASLSRKPSSTRSSARRNRPWRIARSRNPGGSSGLTQSHWRSSSRSC